MNFNRVSNNYNIMKKKKSETNATSIRDHDTKV